MCASVCLCVRVCACDLCAIENRQLNVQLVAFASLSGHFMRFQWSTDFAVVFVVVAACAIARPSQLTVGASSLRAFATAQAARQFE